jgi:hypothetical protein
MVILVEQVRWRRSQIAETVASSHVSASCYGAPKDVRVVPIVESEGKFIQVERQIFLAHVVIRADDSAFQERPESLDCVRVYDAAHVLIVAVPDKFVRASAVGHRVIGTMLIGHYQLDAARDGFVNESHHSVAIRALYHFANDIALASNRADHDGFSYATLRVRIALTEMLVLFLAADQRLINFDNSHQLPELRVGQRRAQTMAHVESRAVRAGSDHAMDLKCADSLFGSQDHVENLEPNQERVFRVLVNRSRDEREPIGVSAPAIGIRALPMPRLGEAVDIIWSLAARARYAIRPTMLREIGPAGILIREESVKLTHRHLASEFRLMFLALFAHDRTIAQSYLSVKYRILTFANDPQPRFNRDHGCISPHRCGRFAKRPYGNRMSDLSR